MLRELHIVERILLVASGILLIPYSISANGPASSCCWPWSPGNAGDPWMLPCVSVAERRRFRLPTHHEEEQR